MAWPAVAAAIAAPVIGGLIGADQANKGRAEAAKSSREAMALIDAVQIPELKEWLLQQYSSAGTFTPDMMQAISLDPSAQGAISTNPLERQKLVSQIDRMMEQSRTGTSVEDQAGYDLSGRNSAAAANAAQQAIMQNYQSRGAGGSGIELASRLNAQQNSADALQKANLEQTANRNNMRMQALQASTGSLSNLRGADYQQALNLANANDQRSQSSWQNAQRVSDTNVGNKNTAGMFNLNNAQNLRNSNVDLSNKQQSLNEDSRQGHYAQQRQKAADKANLLTGQAAQQNTQATQTAGMWAGGGQAVGNMITAANAPTGPTWDPITKTWVG